MYDIFIFGLEKLKIIEVRRSACVYLQEEEIVVGFSEKEEILGM